MRTEDDNPFSKFSLGTQIIILCTFALVLMLFVWLVIVPNIGPLQTLTQKIVPGSPAGEIKATLVVEPDSESAGLSEKITTAVKIAFTKKAAVSGFSFRLKIPAGQGLVVEDANLNQEGIQVKISPELVEAGWIFPVNKVTSAADGQEWWVELNGAWVGTGEPKAVSALTLATFDLRAKAAGTYQLAFDKSSHVSAVYLATPPQPELTLSSAKISFK